jgi:hypothetical protein
VDARVRHVVTHDHFLTGNFTFLRHCSILFIVILRYFGVRFSAKTAAKVLPFPDMAKRFTVEKMDFNFF